MSGGYWGRFLKIDLEKSKASPLELESEVYWKLIGGKGMGLYLLYKMLTPKTSPLSPDNPLILATGPLVGTSTPSSGRVAIVSKSPLTGGLLHSYMGGRFGPELKFTGYDGVVITGRAKEPIILKIEDSNVEFIPSDKLWGMRNSEVGRHLKETYPHFSYISIGPAGENLVRYACIYSDGRIAGRGGGGAVMGSKNLKAILVKGTNRRIPLHRRQEFMNVVKSCIRILRMHKVTAFKLPKDGTSWILKHINSAGILPIRNFQRGYSEKANSLSGEEWRREGYWKSSERCPGCIIGCTKRVDGATPEYETIWSLGPMIGNFSKEGIMELDSLCDDLGIDAISAGGVVAFVMELSERGLLKMESETALTLKWGDVSAVKNLLLSIAMRRGFGDLLAEGVRIASEKLDGETSRYAMHVKGLELPGYDPRGAQGIGLNYATSDRGGCHCRGWTIGKEILGFLGGAEPTNPYGKAELVISEQDTTAVFDSSIVCIYAGMALMLKDIWRLLKTATDIPLPTPYDLLKAGERINNLARLFNLREGITPDEDILPRRLMEEPASDVHDENRVVMLDEMLDEYYQLRGWRDGVPTEETIERLGLSDILDSQARWS